MLKKHAKKLLVAGLVVLLSTLATTALAEAVLTVDDCVKCHAEQPAEIAAAGSAHKTEIDCQACHEGHRPSSPNNIPECSNCHEGEDHFAVGNCQSCHNPHQPLKVALDGDHKAVCVSCHSGPSKEMAASPSMHETFACNFCHADTHGNIPDCVECHEPHSESMTQADCSTCHQAHKPLALSYPESTAPALCASCHDSVFSLLSASKAKHSQVACAECHPGQHKAINACADCHGKPHAEGMHQRFPKCGDCHNIAHDLNNWPAK